MAHLVKDFRYHYLYRVTNLVNGKFYVGIHSTDNLNDNYFGSGKILHRAFKKYGLENFHKQIIQFFDSREELAQAEVDLITRDFVESQDTYNLALGGDGSDTNSGRSFPIEHKSNISKSIKKIQAERRRLGLKRRVNLVECPHCKKSVDPGNLRRWHLDKCKFKSD